MARREGQRAKLFRVLQILSEETDQHHLIATARIIEILRESYGIEAERKSIYNDIEILRDDMGIDIQERKGRGGGFYLDKRLFDLSELKLLVDSVQASRFISASRSAVLIKKLCHFTTLERAGELRRQVYASARVKNSTGTPNAVDRLFSAISRDRQVAFYYTQWNIRGEKVRRRSGKRYQVSPWALLWEEENYYLVAYDEDSAQMRHYRVDKMEDISVLAQPRLGHENYSAEKMRDYAKHLFGMYGGRDPVPVTLDCTEQYVGALLDRFGRDSSIVPQADGHAHVHIRIVPSPPFYGWIAGFGGGVQILEPAEVREQYQQTLRSALGETQD